MLLGKGERRETMPEGFVRTKEVGDFNLLSVGALVS